MARATRTQGTKGVNYTRMELTKMKPLYRVIDDAVAGSPAIKAARELYLPMPAPGSDKKLDSLRYDAYLLRAVWYGATARTLSGFVGEIFDKSPQVQTPSALAYIMEDATGEGVGVVQLAKLVVGEILKKGRGALFVDYPETGGSVTAADREENGVRPVINFYKATQIINWRTRKIGSTRVLSLVVFEEEEDEDDNDGFSIVKTKQHRVLRLDSNGVATAQLFKSGQPAGNLVVLRKGDGTPFTRLPVYFIGSETNDTIIDKPPLYDLADLNIAHYRNSADYEESCFLCGQPTPVITGLTEAWADKYFKEGVGLGSRAAIPLPVGGSATLLQAEANTLPKEAMDSKERQMVALGAKLVEQRDVQQTATEASINSSSEKSILATVADNVSLAFEWAIGYAADYENITERDIVFRLNKEFTFNYASPEAIQATIAAWQSEAIAFSEMRGSLRKSGMATLEDEDAKKAIQEERDMLPTANQNMDPNADPVNDPSVSQTNEV